MNYYYNLYDDRILSDKELSLYIAAKMNDKLIENDRHWYLLDICLGNDSFRAYFETRSQEWDKDYEKLIKKYN